MPAGVLAYADTTGDTPKVSFIHSDRRGDGIAESGSAGQLRRNNTYTEYGTTRQGPPPSPYGFLGSYGRFFDPQTSLYLLGARLYDPTLGRFLSRDPIPGGSANDYEYGGGNPVMNWDAAGTHHCRFGSYEDLFLCAYVEHRGGNWAVPWEIAYGPSFVIAYLLNADFHDCHRWWGRRECLKKRAGMRRGAMRSNKRVADVATRRGGVQQRPLGKITLGRQVTTVPVGPGYYTGPRSTRQVDLTSMSHLRSQ